MQSERLLGRSDTEMSEEGAEKKEVEEWLRKRGYQALASEPTRDHLTLSRLLLEDDHSSRPEDIVRAIQAFIQNFKMNRRRFCELYRKTFVDFVTSCLVQNDGSNVERTSINDITFLAVFSEILQVRLKIISMVDKIRNNTLLGLKKWPKKCLLLQVGENYLPIKKLWVVKFDTNESQFINTKWVSDFEDLGLINDDRLSKSLISSSKPTEDASSVDFQNHSTLDPCKPCRVNFRHLPYPVSKDEDLSHDSFSELVDNSFTEGVFSETCSQKSWRPARFLSDASSTEVFWHHKYEGAYGLTSLAHDSASIDHGRKHENLIHQKFKDKIIQEELEYKKGVIKFYNQAKEYGFILSENEEFFVHKDDLIKAGVNIEQFSTISRAMIMQVEFRVIQYQGKTKISKKAIDIKVY